MRVGSEYENGANDQTENVEISERRLWAAVLLQALEDWRSGNVRRRTEAEKFFFESEKDFATVCRCAGLEPGSVVAKLQKMRTTIQRPTISLVWSRAANAPVRVAA